MKPAIFTEIELIDGGFDNKAVESAIKLPFSCSFRR